MVSLLVRVRLGRLLVRIWLGRLLVRIRLWILVDLRVLVSLGGLPARHLKTSAQTPSRSAAPSGTGRLVCRRAITPRHLLP